MTKSLHYHIHYYRDSVIIKKKDKYESTELLVYGVYKKVFGTSRMKNRKMQIKIRNSINNAECKKKEKKKKKLHSFPIFKH